MKKSLFVAVMLLGAMTMSAAPYKHSIGITAGGLNGFEYKGFLKEHLVIVADLGFRTSATGKVIFHTNCDGERTSDRSDEGVVYWTFESAANMAYQGTIKKWSAGSLQWFAGGGLSLGMIQMGETWEDISDARKNWRDLDSDKREDGMNPSQFKFGFNAYLGTEFVFKKVPLVVGIDFRPGYGLAATSYSYRGWDYDEETGELSIGEKMKVSSVTSFFDWTLSATLRYRF